MENKEIKLSSLVKSSSRFRGGIPKEMVWTVSSLRLFRTCKRKFFWTYIMRLEPRGISIPLLVGLYFHEFLEAWLRTKRAKTELIIARYTDKLRERLEEMSSEFGINLQGKVTWFPAMLFAYTERYADDRKKTNPKQDILEKEFCVQLDGFKFGGKIDHCAFRDGQFIHVEHKTTSRITRDYIRRLPLDAQIRGYVFGERNNIWGSLKVRKVLYDVVLKPQLRQGKNETEDGYLNRVIQDYQANPQKYFYREVIPIHDEDILAFEHELHQTHSEYMWILENAIRDRIDPLHPRLWTPNDAACYDYNTLCAFASPCTVGLDKISECLFNQKPRVHRELGKRLQPQVIEYRKEVALRQLRG